MPFFDAGDEDDDKGEMAVGGGIHVLDVEAACAVEERREGWSVAEGRGVLGVVLAGYWETGECEREVRSSGEI